MTIINKLFRVFILFFSCIFIFTYSKTYCDDLDYEDSLNITDEITNSISTVSTNLASNDNLDLNSRSCVVIEKV